MPKNQKVRAPTKQKVGLAVAVGWVSLVIYFAVASGNFIWLSLLGLLPILYLLTPR